MKTIYKKLLLLLLLLPFTALSQSTLKGTVVDSKTKQPLPGVNVVKQGSTTGASTDFDGSFTLKGLKSGDVLNFTFVGYRKTTRTYAGESTIMVSMQEESNQLQEVVVQTGYGSVKKKDATGSVALLTSKDFNKGAIISVDQLLSGKAAGVRITTAGGSPDSAPNIRIRGGASLSAENKPLIIIDGVAISNDNPAGVNNPLSLINPNDVESFSILKDASATAIYGIRASNGVILITTKKGTSGKPQFNFSSNVAIGKVTDKIDVMNSSDYVKFIQQYAGTIDATNPQQILDRLGVDDPNDANNTFRVDPLTGKIKGRIIADTDWQDQIYRTSISVDNNFSARANLFKSLPMRASVGYTKAEGLVKTSDYQRVNASLKLSPVLFDKHLKIDFNAKGVLTDKNAIDEGGAIGGAVNMDPTKPVYDVSVNNRFGGYYQATALNGNFYGLQGAYNPLAVLEQRTRPEKVARLLTNIELDYKMHFMPDLRAVLNLGLDASESKISEVYADKSIQTYKNNQGNSNPNANYVFNPGENYAEHQKIYNKSMDAYLVYNKTLTGFLTRVDAQAGYAYQDFKIDGTKDNYQYNLTTGLREVNIDANNPTNRYYSPTNLQSFFGRTNFDILNKYMFTATLRADGTSYFKKENRWGYFPAAGFAWKMKEESFLKNSNLIKELKLRIGWGKTGQNSIAGIVGYFPSRPLFSIGNNNSQYLPGINLYSAKAYNADLTWEKTTTINAGLDFEFFKNSILSGSFDIYKRETTDLLSKYTLPPGQGLSNEFIGNVGSTEGKGFELLLNVKAVNSDKFNLGFTSNIAYNYTKVTDLKGVSNINSPDGGIPNGTGGNLAFNAPGEQPHSAWVYQQIYDASGNAIIGAYADLNGDHVINNDDKYYRAIRPNWTFGFGTNINYKNWDFSASFRGQLHGQTYDAKTITNGFIDHATEGTSAALNNVLNFYNGSANPLIQNVRNNIAYSDYMLQDATFVRCDNMTLGYKVNNFVKGAALRLYTSVNNAFLITKYKGQDPESFNGIDNNFYPRPRIYTFGLNLDF